MQDHSSVLALPVVAAQTFDFREASGRSLAILALAMFRVLGVNTPSERLIGYNADRTCVHRIRKRRSASLPFFLRFVVAWDDGPRL